jgi:hypothetical protein
MVEEVMTMNWDSQWIFEYEININKTLEIYRVNDMTGSGF